MHPSNPHNQSYNFDILVEKNPTLKDFVFINDYDSKTVDFSNPDAVYNLNKALLIHYYRLEDYMLPEGYLCPAVPGRIDYLFYIKDILDEINSSKTIKQPYKGLDVGVGANCIYPILGSQHFDWKMVGIDINQEAVQAANNIVAATKELQTNIEIRYQENNANIFNAAIKPTEYFDFTICNPPFHASEAEALKGTMRKVTNISKGIDKTTYYKDLALNFGGKANELWCNGGEALFIKRMIKQSVTYKKQVGVFTTLVSNRSHLNKLYKQLDKLKAEHKTIPMNIGNKKVRMLSWWYNNED